MKSSVAVIGLVCLVGASIILIAACSNGTGHQAESPKLALPASLNDYYPPKNPAPAYLLAMLDLAKPFSGMVCDALEGDIGNARSNFELFKKAYIENSTVIPEWKQKYPMEPIQQLGAVIKSGDPSKIMPAVDAVGAVCHSCHVTYMAPVHQKYRWDDFGDILLTDPLSGQDVSYAGLMLMMQTNFDGIANDIGQGQHENALRQFAGFKERFQAVSEACMICHDTERHYFVSDEITDLISDLQAVLNKSEVDMGQVGGLLQTIGNESCSKCHLVHIPAAYGQQNMKAH